MSTTPQFEIPTDMRIASGAAVVTSRVAAGRTLISGGAVVVSSAASIASRPALVIRSAIGPLLNLGERRQACRTMVGLLALAHDRACEAELSATTIVVSYYRNEFA